MNEMESRSQPGSGADQALPEVHRGHDLELGLLARLRAWTDVFGWLRLSRVLRIAASPPMVLLVSITFAAWLALIRCLAPDAHHWPEQPREAFVRVPGVTLEVLMSQNPATWFFLLRGDDSSAGMQILTCCLSIALWLPAVLILTRQGALLAAGRELESIDSITRRSFQRVPVALLIPIIPFVCAWAVALPVFFLVWMLRLTEGIGIAQVLIGIPIALCMLPVGLLLFGSVLAIPLGCSAVANEKIPDALDSLSRGYESCLRRPLHLLGYMVVAVGLMAAVWLITISVTFFAVKVFAAISAMTGVSSVSENLVIIIMGHLPLMVNLTLFWALVGGIYLLSREATCQQQVEDLWVPEQE